MRWAQRHLKGEQQGTADSGHVPLPQKCFCKPPAPAAARFLLKFWSQDVQGSLCWTPPEPGLERGWEPRSAAQGARSREPTQGHVRTCLPSPTLSHPLGRRCCPGWGWHTQTFLPPGALFIRPGTVRGFQLTLVPPPHRRVPKVTTQRPLPFVGTLPGPGEGKQLARALQSGSPRVPSVGDSRQASVGGGRTSPQCPAAHQP